MLKNLITIALRNIFRDKVYSLINILGLTIGITCSLFLLMYITDELSYDRYHTEAENIYRVVSDIKEPDDAFTWASTQMPLADELRDNYPEVKNAVRFFSMSRDLFKVGDKEFYESEFYFADSTVFDAFSYSFLAGDPATALDQPLSIVITESVARKYFGDPASALNQSMRANRRQEDFKVTGVIRDVPMNSHFRFAALISRNSRAQFTGSWGSFGVVTYLHLPAGYDLMRMQSTLDKIAAEKVDPVFAEMGVKARYRLQRITDIHLYSKIQDEAEAGGDISYIYIFGAVAAFMIAIACINYMNLATARSVNRSREVGMRKVMGAQRGILMVQFITESVIMAVGALGISLAIVYLLLPVFNTLANKQLPFAYLGQPELMGAILAIILLTGIVGGSYPAFYLSGFNPVQVLKGKLAARGGSAHLRKSLVVVQFALSIFMLISTLVVYDQLTFLREKDLGFAKENVVRLNLSNRQMMQQGQALADRLKQLPEVKAVGKASASPGEGIGKALMQVEDADGRLVDRGVDLFTADYDFVGALDMTIVEGRNFSRDNPGDTSHSVLVNESMVRRMNWKDPLGKRFELGDGPNGPQVRKVVGVIRDYNQNSLYDEIEPLMVLLDEEVNYVFVRLAQGDVRTSMQEVEKAWREVYPQAPFEYVFLDADLDSQYQADEKRSQIFTAFSVLTVVIACLGLLGLAAFTTEQRTKEIGVRKVVGASVQSLVVLVSQEFFLLVFVGMAIAFPAAWYFTETWLANFAYRIPMTGEWPTFLLSAILAFLITLLTVGFHVVRAAQANPVRSLRDE
ncbi:MAG: ABC transporter permease [Cyclobacteriaceae bacterium]|nr:ABC transporter permease [Cyclobacteriaceae bacterium]